MSKLLTKYLPSFDPEYFTDIAFYKGLDEIGYTSILIGGTGCNEIFNVVREIREKTDLKVVLYPAGPASVCKADLIIMPDVMNSNSHYARPFGSGSVATAMNIAKLKVDYLPVAYFILGESTAKWYHDAQLVHSEKIILSYCVYAQMMGYKFLALDYEDPEQNISKSLIQKIKAHTDIHLTVSDEVSPQGLNDLLALGVDTVITPSDIFEESANPLQLAKEYYDAVYR